MGQYLYPNCFGNACFCQQIKEGENNFPGDLFNYDAETTCVNKMSETWLTKV